MVRDENDPNHYQDLTESVTDTHSPVKDVSASIPHRELDLHVLAAHEVAPLQELAEVHSHLGVLRIVWQGGGT